MLAAHLVPSGIRSRIAVGEVPAPTLKPRQVLITAHAASINPLDYKVYDVLRHVPLPRIVPGHDVAGVISAVGSGVTGFQVGDEVYGCLPGAVGGTFAEVVRAPASVIARKPKNLSMEEAAATPLVALTAWQALHRTGLSAGDRLLVIGASGGVGSFAVQFARVLGVHVTGVCSTDNIELVRALGADEVIDYQRQSIFHSGQRYHTIFDVAGRESLHHCRKLLEPEGHYLTINPGPRNALDMVAFRQKAHFLFLRSRQRDLNAITALIEAGKVKPVIDRVFPLAQIALAYDYAQRGKPRGKVVVKLK